MPTYGPWVQPDPGQEQIAFHVASWGELHLGGRWPFPIPAVSRPASLSGPILAGGDASTTWWGRPTRDTVSVGGSIIYGFTPTGQEPPPLPEGAVGVEFHPDDTAHLTSDAILYGTAVSRSAASWDDAAGPYSFSPRTDFVQALSAVHWDFDESTGVVEVEELTYGDMAGNPTVGVVHSPAIVHTVSPGAEWTDYTPFQTTAGPSEMLHLVSAPELMRTGVAPTLPASSFLEVSVQTSAWIDSAVAIVQRPRYRFVYPDPLGGAWRIRQRQSLAGSDSWPLRQRQNGGHTGSWALRQRQSGA